MFKAVTKDSMSAERVREKVAEWVGSEAEPEIESPPGIEETPESSMAPMHFGIFDSDSTNLEGQSLPAPGRSQRNNKRSLNPFTASPKRTAKSPRVQTKPFDEDAPSERLSVKGGKKKADALQRASDAWQKITPVWSTQRIWRDKLRKRAMEAAVKSLDGAASNLLPYVDTCSDAATLREKISQYTTDLVPRFELLAKLRQNPFLLVDTPAGEHDFEILVNMSTAMLTNLLLFVSSEAVKGVDQDQD